MRQKSRILMMAAVAVAVASLAGSSLLPAFTAPFQGSQRSSQEFADYVASIVPLMILGVILLIAVFIFIITRSS